MNRKIIISEHGWNVLKKAMITENYDNKINIVKKFLDGNYMRGTYVTDNDDGTKKSVGIFVKLNNNLPTEESLYFDDVFDIVQNKFANILSDKNERDGFLKQVIKDWFDKKITKSGSLSNYNW